MVKPELVLHILSLSIKAKDKQIFVELLNAVYIDHYTNGKRRLKLGKLELFWEETQDIEFSSDYYEERERSKIFIDEAFPDTHYLI